MIPLWEEANFRRMYGQMSDTANPVMRRIGSTGIINLLAVAVSVERPAWELQGLAPAFNASASLGGVSYNAHRTESMVDIDEVPSLKPYDELEYLLLNDPSDQHRNAKVVYETTYRGRVTTGPLDLGWLSLSGLENLIQGILVYCCPASYGAEHDSMASAAYAARY